VILDECGVVGVTRAAYRALWNELIRAKRESQGDRLRTRVELIVGDEKYRQADPEVVSRIRELVFGKIGPR